MAGARGRFRGRPGRGAPPGRTGAAMGPGGGAPEPAGNSAIRGGGVLLQRRTTVATVGGPPPCDGQPWLGLGIRYLPNRSVRFFVTRVNSVLQKSVPIGSYKNSVPRVFGTGKFGSVPVLTERYRVDHKKDVIACLKTNFDMFS
jgi:hypothetical protein